MNGYRLARRALFVVALVVACGAVLTAAAGTGRPLAAQGTTPANLTPPAGQVMRYSLLGIGAQVYTCRASATAMSGFEWSFTAPAAVLLDDTGAIAGTHFGGPTWQANDGSRVAGEAVERAPSPDPNAIPWLLLRGTPAGATGSFGGITYVQRLDTTGGVAPTSGCDGGHVGAVVRVPYSAVYVFFGAA